MFDHWELKCMEVNYARETQNSLTVGCFLSLIKASLEALNISLKQIVCPWPWLLFLLLVFIAEFLLLASIAEANPV